MMMLIYMISAVLLAACILISRRERELIVCGAVFYALQAAFGVWLAYHDGAEFLTFFKADRIGILLFCIMAVISPVVFRYSLRYLDEETPAQRRVYHALVMLLCMAMGCVYFSDNLAVTWIFLEATTLCTAGLIYHRRTPRSLEATWKYIFVCSVGISIAYLGILLMASMAHHGSLAYGALAEVVQDGNPLFMQMGFLFMLVGYSCKMEVFPLYTTGIDANHATPTPASALVSTALVNAGFLAVYRIYRVLMRTEIAGWISSVLIIAGVLSLVIGAFYLRRTKHYKRFLAYSTVENMGIVLIGLGIGGLGVAAAVFHVAGHSLLKSAMFLQLAQVGKAYGNYQINRSGRYIDVNKAGGILILVTSVLLLAFPPSPLFVSELMIFKQIIAQEKWWLLVVMVLLICTVMYVFGRNIMRLCFQPMKQGEEPAGVKLNLSLVLPVLALLVTAVVLALWQPDWMKYWLMTITRGMGSFVML